MRHLLPDPSPVRSQTKPAVPLLRNADAPAVPGVADRLFIHYDRTVAFGFVLDIDGAPPGIDALREHLRHRTGPLAALHLLPHRASSGWQPVGRPLDLTVHVRQGPDERSGLARDEMTNELIRKDLPQPPHPPWDMWLLTNQGHHSYRICFRMDHALCDGVGAAYYLAALLADQELPAPHLHRPARPTLAAASRFARNYLRRPPRGRAWPDLSADYQGGARIAYVDVLDDRLRALARAWGVTVNDVYLTALALALPVWHSREFPESPFLGLTAAVPLSVRTSGNEGAPGNHVVSMDLALPRSPSDPRHCLEAVLKQTRQAAHTGYRDTAHFLIERVLSPWLTRPDPRPRHALTATHLKLPSPWTVFGSSLTAAGLFCVPAGKMPCYVSLTRTAAMARFGVVHDRRTPGATRLPELWRNALSELESRVDRLAGEPVTGACPSSPASP
ncbi:wax ester/triacylglycerol synthase domain-containing protein [Streptomyces syringium]|uniref:wax ester/triacylglycerol synthase domain-containing protein n=1 Tax=Streptomyces syringium TaxID=76729 RepID=UPI0033AEA1A3